VGVRDLTDDVVAAAQAGDGAAFRLVYTTLSPAVVGYLRGKGVSDPEGTANEVFLTLVRQLHAVRDGAAGLRRLVFTIAHARVVDELRQRSRRPSAVPFEAELDTRRVPSAEELAETRLPDTALVTAMRGLPDDQREAVLLRVVADLSIEEVARIMGRSQGAVKQLQRRALLELRSQLAGCE
jgi:RNA polymerase sigma-70 factor (ECF subfamily)